MANRPCVLPTVIFSMPIHSFFIPSLLIVKAMAFVKTVEHYSAFHYPLSGESFARMNLYCQDGYKLYIRFFEEAGDLPNNSYHESAKVGSAYAPISYYADYIDLLRNEGPIRVTFRPEDSPPRFVVYASREEPGEGEM